MWRTNRGRPRLARLWPRKRQSIFVWAVIGAISQVTSLPVTTAVTCPTTRIHPAIIAQAAATASLLTGGKFTLGVGTGEALNEHVTGAKWPAAEERREMLEEAVTIITKLFTGQQLTHAGQHYQVDTARLYSVPRVPPPVYVSGFGENTARLAARIPDGFVRGFFVGADAADPDLWGFCGDATAQETAVLDGAGDG
jgi:G6PDH family F420-dependent oxidoreductase